MSRVHDCDKSTDQGNPDKPFSGLARHRQCLHQRPSSTNPGNTAILLRPTNSYQISDEPPLPQLHHKMAKTGRVYSVSS